MENYCKKRQIFPPVWFLTLSIVLMYCQWRHHSTYQWSNFSNTVCQSSLVASYCCKSRNVNILPLSNMYREWCISLTWICRFHDKNSYRITRWQENIYALQICVWITLYKRYIFFQIFTGWMSIPDAWILNNHKFLVYEEISCMSCSCKMVYRTVHEWSRNLSACPWQYYSCKTYISCSVTSRSFVSIIIRCV